MFYVCELGRPFGILAGPYTTEAEATAASGAIEIEHPQYLTRTEVWNYQQSEPESIAAVVALPGTYTLPVAVH
jgi:hypothetical protein